MPLVQEAATVDTACISTAPVWVGDGAPKQVDPGWWAAVVHNRGGARPVGPWLQTALWAVYLGAIVATLGIEHFGWFVGAVVGLVLASSVLPDDGATVLPYCIHIVLPIITFKSVLYGGWASFIILAFVFVCIPIADALAGVDAANQTRSEQKDLQHAVRFKLHTLLVVPCVAGMLVLGAWVANDMPLTTLELVGLAVSVGTYSGAIGIVVGHELCHKAAALERMGGRFLLVAVSYGHFYVEHTLGHHKDVATDRDVATARYGDNFWFVQEAQERKKKEDERRRRKEKKKKKEEGKTERKKTKKKKKRQEEEEQEDEEEQEEEEEEEEEGQLGKNTKTKSENRFFSLAVLFFLSLSFFCFFFFFFFGRPGCFYRVW